MQIMVAGKVEARAYLDNSGQPAASLELTARDVQFLGSRDGQQAGASSEDMGAPPEDVGDIPF
jgi:single-stranded DNA-binding protein